MPINKAFLEIVFQDNNGVGAQMRLSLNTELSYDAHKALMDEIINACNSLSNAVISSATLRYIDNTSYNNPASIDSNSYARLIAFFTNGEYVSSLSIPSPGFLPYDVDGNWRDFRIKASEDTLSNLQALATLIVGVAQDDAGRLYAGDFVYACRT